MYSIYRPWDSPTAGIRWHMSMFNLESRVYHEWDLHPTSEGQKVTELHEQTRQYWRASKHDATAQAHPGSM